MYSSPGIHRMSAKPVRSIYGDRLNESGIFMLQDEKSHLPDPGDGFFQCVFCFGGSDQERYLSAAHRASRERQERE